MEKIKTLEQLDAIVGEDSGLWFLSLVDANNISSQLNNKDLAILLADGIAPMNERWQDVLSSLGKEDENLEYWPTEEDIHSLMQQVGW